MIGVPLGKREGSGNGVKVKKNLNFSVMFLLLKKKKDKVNIPKYQQHPNQSGRNTGVYYI